MSVMEFVVVAHAIIVGLGVAELLRGFADYLRAEHRRKSVRQLFIASWTLLLLLQVWWAIWRVKDREVWTFPEFLVFLLPVALLYVVGRLSFPLDQDDVDLVEYFERVAPRIWTLVAATFLSFILLQPLLYGGYQPTLIATQVPIAVAALIASRVKARSFHLLVMAAMLLQVSWRALIQVVSG